VATTDETANRKLSRRQLLERLLSGAAAGATWPLLASAHPIYQHLQNDLNSGAMLDRASQLSKTDGWSPLFLSAAQNAELVALAECIVPGSTKASVNRFIDLLLSVETADNQEKFRASLSAVENEAKKRYERLFSALATTQQESLLTTFSQDPASQKDFDNLKEWIVGAYYSSEEGLRELGWDGTYAFAGYPECEHPVGTN
jgi:hypothetical protein